MSLDFSNVTQWTIPEGEVLSASLNGVTVWTQPQQHTYEPTSQNGNGLYGLVDGQYVPLTCLEVTIYTYKCASNSNISTGYKPYIKQQTYYNQMGTSIGQIANNGQWVDYKYYYKDSSYYYGIYRTSSTSYSYTDPNGNAYTGQRYIQTS